MEKFTFAWRCLRSFLILYIPSFETIKIASLVFVLQLKKNMRFSALNYWYITRHRTSGTPVLFWSRRNLYRISYKKVDINRCFVYIKGLIKIWKSYATNIKCPHKITIYIGCQSIYNRSLAILSLYKNELRCSWRNRAWISMAADKKFWWNAYGL